MTTPKPPFDPLCPTGEEIREMGAGYEDEMLAYATESPAYRWGRECAFRDRAYREQAKFLQVSAAAISKPEGGDPNGNA